MRIQAFFVAEDAGAVRAGVTLVPVFVGVHGSFALPLQRLRLGLVGEDGGSQLRGCHEGSGTNGKRRFRLFAPARSLLPGTPEGGGRGRGGPAARRLAQRVAPVQPVLATVRLHVVRKGKFLATVEAAEGLLARVQVLVLMEEAAVLERLPADVAEVGAHAGRVPPPVILHDGVVSEDQAALGALVRFQGGVAPLVAAQRRAVREGLAALLALEDALLGVDGHVLGDGHLELELLAAQRAVVRLLRRAAAAVGPQGVHRVEDAAARRAFEGAFVRWGLLLRGEEKLLLLFVLVSVFDQAAPVLEGQAALLARQRRELVLVRVKVAVEVKRLAPVEHHPAVFAQHAALFGFRRRVGVLRRALADDRSLPLLSPVDIARPPLSRSHA